jgi:hypothetical protein
MELPNHSATKLLRPAPSPGVGTFDKVQMLVRAPTDERARDALRGAAQNFRYLYDITVEHLIPRWRCHPSHRTMMCPFNSFGPVEHRTAFRAEAGIQPSNEWGGASQTN